MTQNHGSKLLLSQFKTKNKYLTAKIQELNQLQDLTTLQNNPVAMQYRSLPKEGIEMRSKKVCGQIQRAQQLLIQLQQQNQTLIDLLPDDRHKTVVQMRYLNLLSWQEIERLTHYSHSHLMRLHEKALRVLDKQLNQETQ